MAEYVNSESILEVDFLNSIIVDTNNTIILEDGRKVVSTQKFNKDFMVKQYLIN